MRAAYSVALSGIPLRIASTVTHQDMEHLEDFIKMAINLGASYFIIGEVIPSGRAFDNEDIFLSREDHNFFLRKMDELKEKYENQLSILVSGLTKTQLDYFSQGTIDGAIIRPNGDIRLDCSCPFVIGNILKDDIETVWKEKSISQKVIQQRSALKCQQREVLLLLGRVRVLRRDLLTDQKLIVHMFSWNCKRMMCGS